MNVGAHGRQSIKRGHRRLELVADATDVDDQGRGLFRRQAAAQESDHREEDRASALSLREWAWHNAMASASAASAPIGPEMFNRRFTINCTCCFSAAPVPTTASFTSRGAYS